MKSLIILIYSICAIWFLGFGVSKAQVPTFRAGIYDFVDNTASEFYHRAPTIMVGYDIWKKSQLSNKISTGVSYNRIKYNSHYHYLYMIPLMSTIYYDLPNPGTKIWPSIGAGMGLMWKVDRNKNFDKTHYSLAYGYHATGSLNIPMKGDLILTLEMTYNMLIPPVSEEIDISGIILTIGLNFPVKHGSE